MAKGEPSKELMDQLAALETQPLKGGNVASHVDIDIPAEGIPAEGRALREWETALAHLGDNQATGLAMRQIK